MFLGIFIFIYIYIYIYILLLYIKMYLVIEFCGFSLFFLGGGGARAGRGGGGAREICNRLAALQSRMPLPSTSLHQESLP